MNIAHILAFPYLLLQTGLPDLPDGAPLWLTILLGILAVIGPFIAQIKSFFELKVKGGQNLKEKEAETVSTIEIKEADVSTAIELKEAEFNLEERKRLMEENSELRDRLEHNIQVKASLSTALAFVLNHIESLPGENNFLIEQIKSLIRENLTNGKSKE